MIQEGLMTENEKIKNKADGVHFYQKIVIFALAKNVRLLIYKNHYS